MIGLICEGWPGFRYAIIFRITCADARRFRREVSLCAAKGRCRRMMATLIMLYPTANRRAFSGSKRGICSGGGMEAFRRSMTVSMAVNS